MITELRLSEDALGETGLVAPLHMRGLGSTVVLAGPNGGGKSRLLRCIGQLEDHRQRLEQRESDLWTNDYHDLQKALTRWDYPKELLPACEKAFENKKQAIQEAFDGIHRTGDRRAAIAVSIFTYDFSKTVLEWRNLAPDARRALVDNFHVGFEESFGDAYARLGVYLADMAGELHTRSPTGVRFAELVKRFSGLTLGHSADGQPLIEDRPFSVKALSKGELVLLTWAIQVHRIGRRFGPVDDSVVIIDEPELYLHPAACLRALRVLREELLSPEHQIWIATHSMPLVASMGAESVYWVRDGRVDYGPKYLPELVEGLLGNSAARDDLRATLHEAHVVSFYRYCVDSLRSPPTAPLRDGDPQAEQACLLIPPDGARLLDYSAGQGRLADALCGLPAALLANLDYLAYADARYTPQVDRARCSAAVERLRAAGCRSADLIEAPPDELQADIVLLANTLHEIPVAEWVDAFAIVRRNLQDGGRLLLFEDLYPSVGELPTSTGFLILNRDELAVLFRDDSVELVSSDREGRLQVTGISAGSVANVSPDSIVEALRMLHARATRSALERRQEGRIDYEAGRLHACDCLLATNAALALSELGAPLGHGRSG